jgi:mRNA interferase RelE/StbE
MKTIVLTDAAAKDFAKLPEHDQAAVESALDDYAISGRGNVIALQGRAGFRLRVGAYRVIFGEDATTILAIYIGRRSTTTYKRN